MELSLVSGFEKAGICISAAIGGSKYPLGLPQCFQSARCGCSALPMAAPAFCRAILELERRFWACPVATRAPEMDARAWPPAARAFERASWALSRATQRRSSRSKLHSKLLFEESAWTNETLFSSLCCELLVHRYAQDHISIYVIVWYDRALMSKSGKGCGSINGTNSLIV